MNPIPTPTVVQDFPLASIEKNTANPRTITKENETALKESLSKFGMVGVLVVNERADGRRILVSGHQRLKALQSAGETTAPVIVTHLSVHDEIALGLQMNTHAGHFVEDKLKQQLDAIEQAGRDLAALGLQDDAAYKSIMGSLEDLIADNTPSEEPKTKPAPTGPTICTIGQYRVELSESETALITERAQAQNLSTCEYAIERLGI
jgi:ParB-like chromosome segregation protein Spo0J